MKDSAVLATLISQQEYTRWLNIFLLTCPTNLSLRQVVLNFLHVRGFPADQFKFLQSWPRRDLSSLNVAKTLREYNIPNQETITIEER